MNELRGFMRWGNARSIPSVVAASALAVSVLVVGPLMLGQRPTERFLLWNLALAWIPLVAALCLEAFATERRIPAAVVCGAVWLLFLPNAPYLVSDLAHFNNASATPWLDLSRLFAFAWAGCLLAVVSLRIVHRIVRALWGPIAGSGVVIAAATASGVGIALGRFSRLNSWELATQPASVLTETLRIMTNYRTSAVAAFFGLLVLVMYLGMGGARQRSAL
jgi:uncharacterized membrane protein